MKTKLSAIGRIPLNAGLLSSLILLIASIVLSTLSFAQPNWQWAKSAGGILYDGANSVAADSSGNIYVAGVFESASITFGTTTLNNSSTDTTDMFLVKYDAGGNVLWATSAGGTDFDDAASVAADLSGNIFVTGSFSGASITFGSTTLTNTGANADMYIVKYDAGGNVLWAKSAGGNYEDKATCVATDISGNIIVTGYYQAAPITFDSYTLSNSGSYDMFIVKYDASGNALWANRAGGSNDDRGYSVTADASGNVIVAGAFLSSSITIGTTTLNYAGGAYTDIFIVKYDASGNALWANSAGGTYWDEPNSVTTDASGNIFMAGIVYSSSITFGSTTLTNSGSSFYCEMFIVKYDVSGNVQWAQGAGARSNNDIAYSVDADAAGNSYVVGIYGAPITFGTITLTGGGIFIVKYEGSGTALWAIGVPGGSANAVTVIPSGDIYVAGTIYSPSITFGSTTLTNAGVYDMFLAKLATSTGIPIANGTASGSAFTVYPNPATDELRIEDSGFRIDAVEIYDVLGKKILSEQPGTKHQALSTINVSSLTPGIYFIFVRQNQSITTRKVVIQ